MFSTLAVIIAILLFMAVLFVIALWVERVSDKRQGLVNNAIVYTLSLAVYCTTWTFYGSVGSAASSGMLFLGVYLGPTIIAILWWTVLRKMVRLKSTYHTTSIADFVASRYNRSQPIAALATLMIVVGVAPYIALQLRAVISTFDLITTPEGPAAFLGGGNVGILVVGLMILFTIAFGARRLDPTERHAGMTMAVAVQSVVKLVAFLTVGIFVCFVLFNGVGDIFQRWNEAASTVPAGIGAPNTAAYFTWTSYLVLSMFAVMLLPRMFHVAVVENSNEKHIRTAMWLFPLYLLLICIFALPIAKAGLLMGLPLQAADTFVLALPLAFGESWLVLLVFLGGLAAAASMIMVSVMTMSVMITNHWVLPLAERSPRLGFLRRNLLRVRWVAIVIVVLIGYWFERQLGGSYTLVSMGIISFAAALQFAPAIVGGLFWRRANRAGALLGMGAGFLIWFYTLLLPSFAKSGWLPGSLLDSGPWGIWLLNPEQLFGLSGLDSLTHALVWSMVFNIGFYVLGSLFFEPGREESQLADSFVDVLDPIVSLRSLTAGEATVDLAAKMERVEPLLGRYLTPVEADAMLHRCLIESGVEGRTKLSVVEWADLCSHVETALSGTIGAAAAHSAISRGEVFTPEETSELSEAYGDILASLRVSPEDLQERIDYYRERDLLLSNQTAELEGLVVERTRALEQRNEQMEAAALVAREAASIRDVSELLDTTVRLISDRFDFYHAGIFLLDENRTSVVLQAASSQGGQRMLERGHRLAVGEQGIVGHVAAMGEPRVAFNVGDDTAHFDNPDLMETSSEMALPLKFQERVIGVLDVQSRVEAAFGVEEVAILQTMADQLAIAIENARLVADTQATLAEVQEVQHRYLSDAWAREAGKRSDILGSYQRPGAATAADDVVLPIQEALATGDLESLSKLEDESYDEILAVPLRIGDQMLGIIEVRDTGGERQWTDSDRSLLEQVGEQMSLAMETTRLFQETRRRADRERMIGEISAKIRASANMQDIMETAAVELGRALGTSRALIRLTPGEQAPETGTDEDEIADSQVV